MLYTSNNYHTHKTELYFGLFMILDTREPCLYKLYTHPHTNIPHIPYILYRNYFCCLFGLGFSSVFSLFKFTRKPRQKANVYRRNLLTKVFTINSHYKPIIDREKEREREKE